VGKTFAYLLPAIEQASTQGKCVVVSTHTIALQEQLINKDIPFLRSALPFEFTAVLVKGRSNYVGLRRLALASRRQGMLFERMDDLEQLHAVEDWAYQTTDGSLADLPVLPAPGVWEKVRSEQGNCMGRRCETYEKCFYQQARRRAENAKLLVVNHALLFSDLALRRHGASILPKYDFAILDEAHMVESAAGDHFGMTLADTQVRYLLNSLHNERNQKGSLAGGKSTPAVKAVKRAREAANHFFEELVAWQRSHGRSNGRLLEPPPVRNTLSAALLDVRQEIKALRGKSKDEEDRFELNSQAEQLTGFSQLLGDLLGQKEPDWVYWLEVAMPST
jgi:ATP-dependent DNA helicase DinG